MLPINKKLFAINRRGWLTLSVFGAMQSGLFWHPSVRSGEPCFHLSGLLAGKQQAGVVEPQSQNACSHVVSQSAMGPNIPLRISPHAYAHPPSRIVIVTLANRQDRLKEHDHFAASLARYLNSQGRFQVVVAKDRVCENEIPMRRGAFDERRLVVLSQAYQADTVMYCEVNTISAYAPMRMSASFLLVSINQAVALVEGNINVDLQHERVRNSFDHFTQVKDVARAVAVQHHSPSQLIQYSADSVAKRLAKLWP